MRMGTETADKTSSGMIFSFLSRFFSNCFLYVMISTPKGKFGIHIQYIYCIYVYMYLVCLFYCFLYSN